MAAAVFPAWFTLQPGARTLRAFSTAVSPATLAGRPGPRTTERTSRSDRPLRRKSIKYFFSNIFSSIFKVKLSSLNLDDHAKKKLIKLVGERYCKTTDVLTIKTDRCPLKRQNYDYAMYLLTVLYHESWKTEEWEKNKTEEDMEEYIWKNSSSEKNILETLLKIKAADKNLEVNKEELLGTKEVEDYKKSVVSLKNEGDNENTLAQYKESVKRLLNLT
ncbi:PREDICTED: 28S ribosomal protein S35, mitochondrial [Hipposideros armiger]|uniref:28S ribosomal protein S35, mitochondrial n=1 Tax=Hipposideros armiger TaxID=186990 RepID=A0A8B7TIQ8_HIPAR|nr:PREDICTED: 28S ribosomal protein S35, mitochondrial [Hipposideros armiger]